MNKDRGEEVIYAGTWALGRMDGKYQDTPADGGPERTARAVYTVKGK